MLKWLRSFFAVDNQVNEDTVIGVVFVIVLITATFMPIVAADKYYVLAGLVAACFGLAALKK
jgi:hypothetical protein